MSVIFVSIYYFLLVELVMVLLLLSPLKFMRKCLSNYVNLLLTSFHFQLGLFVIAGMLALIFIDAVNETKKLSNSFDVASAENIVYYQNQVRYFRSQRNQYITGLSLLCGFIILRVSALIADDEDKTIETGTVVVKEGKKD